MLPAFRTAARRDSRGMFVDGGTAGDQSGVVSVQADRNGRSGHHSLSGVALLFFSIRIFMRHCKSAMFLPFAVLLSLWIIYVINSTYGPVATTDLWTPYILLFVFLLFTVLRAFLRANRMTIIVSTLLIAVVLAPIILDVFLDHPNNVQKIRTYLSEHRGAPNRLLTAVQYEGSFFTFTADPETRIAGSSSAHLVSTAAARPYILSYWVMAFFLACMAVAVRRKATAPIPRFLIYIGFEALLVSALFVYWAKRITGPLYSFNGHFFYAVQFLILFTLAAVALDGFQFRVNRGFSTALACALPLLMFVSPARFNRVGTNPAAVSDPWFEHAAEDTQRIATSLPRQDSWIRIRTPDGDDGLLRRTGVASRLHWAGRRVCLDDKWIFLLEDRNRCEHVEGLLDLDLNPTPQPDAPWSANLRPFPAESLPFTIDPRGSNSLTVNSYARENFPGGPIWTRKQSRMRFLLGDHWNSTPEVHIEVRGISIKARPVEVLLNEQKIGRISGEGPVSSDFVVQRDLFRAGHENEIAFKAADSQQMGRDIKNLAFDLESIRFQPMPLRRTDHNRDGIVSHKKAAPSPLTR